MIIVSGLQRKTGEVRTQSYQPGQEGPARKYRAWLRSLGYNTVFVNDVAARYTAATASAVRDSEPFELEFEGIKQYQLHSLGTRSGCMTGKHIAGESTVTDAIETAELRVGGWSDSHKGIVIYRAIKLVRKVVKPTTEVVELA